MQIEHDFKGIGYDSYYVFRLNLAEYFDPQITHKLYKLHKQCSQGNELVKRLFLNSLNSLN